MADISQKFRYVASYYISHGVSHGFGIKYPDESTETKDFTAATPLEAIMKVEEYALNLANNYLSNPDTGRTTVRLTRLEGQDGVDISIIDEIKNALPANDVDRFEAFKKLRFPDGKHLVVERTWIDQVVKIAMKEASERPNYKQ